MKSTLFSFMALAGFVYFCFCAYLYLFQRSLIYFPTPATAGSPAEEVWLDNDGEKIRLWRLHAGRPDAILYFGGNAEDVSLNIRDFSLWFPDHAVYLVNYRGYGGSTGAPAEAALFGDARAAFALASSHHDKVSLMGRSLGAAVALHVASANDVSRVVLVTPFDSLAGLAREYYPIFPTSLLLKDRYDAARLAARVRAPVLVVIAGSDEIVPASSAERLIAAFGHSQVTVRIIEGATHNSVGAFPAFARLLQEFMAGHSGAVRE